MGAGIQRWWRDYEQECTEWDRAQDVRNGIFWVNDNAAIGFGAWRGRSCIPNEQAVEFAIARAAAKVKLD